MKTVILRIPDDIHAALKQRKGSVNANVCQLLATSLGIDYTPPKKGGWRIPKSLSPEQAELLQRHVQEQPQQIVKKKSFVRTVEPTQPTGAQHATPLQPNVKLKEQGYPYAEGVNGVFTGKLLKEYIAGSANVGEMTLVEFQRRAGKKAYIDG